MTPRTQTRHATSPRQITPQQTGSGTAPTRVVLVVRAALTPNMAVNAAAVLGATIGSRLSLPLGPEGTDASGVTFPGIVTTPIPVLVAGTEELSELFERIRGDDVVQVVCLTEVARQARIYDEYLHNLGQTPGAATDIAALCLAGPRNRVTKLTKRLALLGTGG